MKGRNSGNGEALVVGEQRTRGSRGRKGGNGEVHDLGEEQGGASLFIISRAPRPCGKNQNHIQTQMQLANVVDIAILYIYHPATRYLKER